MTDFNIKNACDRVQNFEFKTLFIEELGWSNPPLKKSSTTTVEGFEFEQRPLAELGGVMVFEIVAKQGKLPDNKIRAAIQQEISQYHHENLLIFVDQRPQPMQSLWYWIKRENHAVSREHYYFRGQSGDGLISKLVHLLVDLSEFDDRGHISVVKAVEKLRNALDVEKVTKRFYGDFEQEHLAFLELIGGIESERDRKWYASVLLNRLMFIWFLQKKGFLGEADRDYLPHQLQKSQQSGENQFYTLFLQVLFFEGFAKPAHERSANTQPVLGQIPYLNGGLFLPHVIEQRWSKITVVDQAFQNIFALFSRYSWSLDDSPGGQDNEVNPDVLGYIFEKYINQKQFGAYYTRPEMTEYLCIHTIDQLILDKINHPEVAGVVAARQFASVPELLTQLDAPLCRELLQTVLPQLKLLDPACGSGAFLVAAMKVLIQVYSAVLGKIQSLSDQSLTGWLQEIEKTHHNLNYFIKKRIITHNLFGVDIMEEATEIAKLRLFLALVSSAATVEQLEPLPNIDFNILAGNSLIGLLKVDGERFAEVGKSGDLFKDLAAKSYQQILAEKNRLIALYREATGFAPQHLQNLRDEIYAHKRNSQQVLNQLLLQEFELLKIKFEQATWDSEKNKEGKTVKRPVTVADIEALQPFHWGYEFDEVLRPSSPALLPAGEESSPRPLGEELGVRGGFDAIITNPPWEIFKPQAKEFFAEFSDIVTKNKMTIKEFEKEQDKLLKNTEIQEAWLIYQSRFPFVSQYFRASSQYFHQAAVVNGKKTGTDVNLYKLFVEQCVNLLRAGGQCGMVIPSGIYTDLGATGLRTLLFEQTQITGLFGFENRKAIFEGVDSRFKFIVLTLTKGSQTECFPAAFMRHEVKELQDFPQTGALWLKTALIRKLSPDSHSVMEFKSERDIAIAEKMLQFPLLGEKLAGVWNLVLANEFHMTNDSHLFKIEPARGRLPLYEGKMIHQFNHRWGEPKYWIDEQEGRKALLGKREDKGQVLDYQGYRLGFRDVASNTNERTMIATILPPAVFTGNTLINSYSPQNGLELLAITALLNSFVVDALIRQKVTAHCNMFYVYQLPIPRLTEKDPPFKPIVTRAAQLICTTPEFDELAKEVGLDNHKQGVTDSQQRTQLRAELDAMIAHLYGLTEEEFRHILMTFPLVKDDIKEATLLEYQKL